MDLPAPVSSIADAMGPPTPGEPYRRTPLGGDAGEEVLLMRWCADGQCAPHDHGAAAGVIHLVRGEVVERRFRFDGQALLPIAERRLGAPALIAVEAGVIHEMRAIGEALTLHVYRPRIEAMRVYDATRRETLVVHDDCGAWIPEDAALVRAREPWAPR